jgi:hypothetical protein
MKRNRFVMPLGIDLGDHPLGAVIKHPRKERWEKDFERY